MNKYVNIANKYAMIHVKILDLKKSLNVLDRLFEKALENDYDESELIELSRRIDDLKDELENCKKEKCNIAILYADETLLKIVS